MPIPAIGAPPTATPVGASPSGGPSKPSFGAALRARSSPAVECPAPRQVARAALEHVECARQLLDEALAAARRGRTFTAQELLALQADAYRFSQTMEVASKVVEQGAQSVKQAVNAQV